MNVKLSNSKKLPNKIYITHPIDPIRYKAIQNYITFLYSMIKIEGKI